MLENSKIVEKGRKRVRSFAVVLYPDSVNADWQQILESLHTSCYWILHDLDTDENGELKKPHFHVLINFRNPMDITWGRCLAEELGAPNGHYEAVTSVKGYARYMCHLDEGENKHKYGVDEVHVCGDGDIRALIGADLKSETLAEIIKHCKDNDIYSYSRLIDYCLECKRDWFEVLCKTTYGRVVRDYIKSMYWTRHNAL